MSDIIRTQNSEGTPLVYMKGVIDEKTALEASIGPLQDKLKINARGITRLNSSGVKSWLEYFRKLRDKKIILTFQECSVALVVQTSMFQDFLCGGAIESLFVPLICDKCGKSSEKLVAADEVRKSEYKIPTSECPHCKEVSATFDETPEYFRVLVESLI